MSRRFCSRMSARASSVTGSFFAVTFARTYSGSLQPKASRRSMRDSSNRSTNPTTEKSFSMFDFAVASIASVHPPNGVAVSPAIARVWLLSDSSVTPLVT